MMGGACGECVACCRVFAIPQVDKRAGDWCRHCDVGKGCKIYEERPQVCREFECLWLQCQGDDRKMAAELRPDRCRVVFSPTTSPDVISAMPMPGTLAAWRREGPMKLIRAITSRGIRVVVGPPSATRKTMLRMEAGKLVETEIEMTPPDETGMQWSKP